MTEAANDQILSDAEEATLQDLLYEDIKSRKLTTVAEVGDDRGWQMRLAIYRVRQLIEGGRVGYAANPNGIILYARNPFPRSPRDEEIDQMKEALLGLTLTDVIAKDEPNGERYTRLVFGDRFYQFLAHFTSNDHQVAIATWALQEIQREGRTSSAAIATAALEDMEKFKSHART